MTQENGEVERIARAFYAARAELCSEKKPGVVYRQDKHMPWGELPQPDRELLEATVRLMLKWDVIRPGRRRRPR